MKPLPVLLPSYCWQLLQQWPPTNHLPLVVTLLLALPLLASMTTAIRGWCWKSRSSNILDRLQHLPPGPTKLPILGNLHQIIMGGELPHQRLCELARRHGPVMLLRLGMVPTVVVSSAKAAREVLKTHDADCCSRPDTVGARRLSYGHKDVSTAPYGSHWREMRKILVVEVLSKSRVNATWDARESQVDKLISRLTSAAGGGKPVVLEDHIFGVMDAADSDIGTVTLGNIHGTQQFAQKQRIHQVFFEALTAKASFTAEDYFPNVVGRLVDGITGMAAQRERAFKNLDDLYEMVIQQHLAEPSSQAELQGNGPDLIDAFISHMTKEHKAPGSLEFTKDHVKGLLSNVIGGAINTSSVTMIWAMAEMMKNPAALKKAQEEVRAVVGRRSNNDHHRPWRVQPDDLPKLKYLNMVIKETLRLHPTAPFLVPRETQRHVKICGYDVPAKTRLYVNAWAIGRDPASWPGNPDEFDPDRFEAKNVDFNGMHFELVPFGAGRRMCPGMAMGLATMEFTLANLLCCFDWALPEGVKSEDMSMEEEQGLTVRKKVPLVLVPKIYNWQR